MENLKLARDICEESTVTVFLLDGTEFDFDPNKPRSLTNESGGRSTFDVSWIDRDSFVGAVLFTELLNMLSTHSRAYCCAVSYIAKAYFKRLSISQDKALELKPISLFARVLSPSYWPFYRALLIRLADIDSALISQELKNFLQSPARWEFTKGGAYFPLLTNDHYHGAFTEQELRNIQNNVDRAYWRGWLSLGDYALIWTFISTGLRPIQIAGLKISDVLINDGPGGKEVTLMVPLAKGEKSAKVEKWARRAPTVLASILIKYIDRYAHSKSQPIEGEALFHSSAIYLGNRLKSAMAKLDTWSERINGPIPISPYRFRYTLGTRALAQGASDHEVARLLTHRGISCIRYYRASLPTLQEPIKEAIGEHMNLLADAFRDRIRSDKELVKGSDLVRDFQKLKGEAVGTCDASNICHQNAPVACLSCDKFRPFVDAPWEEMQSILNEDMNLENEPRIRNILLNAFEATSAIIAIRDKQNSLGSA